MEIKRITAAMTAACMLMSFAAGVFAEDIPAEPFAGDAAEEEAALSEAEAQDSEAEEVSDAVSEKIFDLINDDSEFNHIVIKNTGDVPSDLRIEYSDDNGESWGEFEYNVNNNGVMGYIYGGSGGDLIPGSEVGNFCTYRTYTADAVRLSSESADVDSFTIGVFNAEDIAPTSAEIKADNSLISTAGDNGEELFMEEVYNGNRLNNKSNVNPAYLYNADIDGNLLYDTGGSDNKTGSVIIDLGEEREISKIGFGNMIGNGFSNTGRQIGDRYAAYYEKDGVWRLIEEVDNNTADTRVSHATINSGAVKTDKIKLTFTFNGNKNGAALPGLEQGAAKPPVQAVWLSYIGIYDFGENLIYQDRSNYSESVDLGETVTFNRLCAEPSSEADKLSWQYSDDGAVWSEITDGKEISARYIRTAAAPEAETPSVPAFSLSWEGNLIEYADKGCNGASKEGTLQNNDVAWKYLYNGDTAGTDGQAGLVANEQYGDLTLDLNAPAEIRSLHGYYGSGCWYPSSYTVEMSNRGELWVRAAEENFRLRLNASGEHPTNEAVHYSAFEHETSFTDAEAAMVRLSFRGSMRTLCEGYTGNDVRISELILDGSVRLAEYDGSEVEFNIPGDDPPKIKRETSRIFVDGVEQDISAGAAHIPEGSHEISGEVVSENGNGTAYLGVYENGVLKAVAVDSEPEYVNYSNEYKASLEYSVPSFHPTLEIKLFFWDKDSMEPIHAPVVIAESLYKYPKSPDNTMFEKGDVVGFIGDSITHADNMNTPNYMSFIYDYYITRMPDEPVKLVNLGIASYTAGDVLNTFDENVAVGGIRKADGSAWANINKATLMIGMNDINRGLYNQSNISNNEAQRQEKIDESSRNTKEILSRLNSELGIAYDGMTLITPSIFDNTKVSNTASSNPCFANNGLVILAGLDKQLAEELGTQLVDFNAPMLEINKAYQARNYDGTIIRDDLVHPRGMGHTMMGYLFLQQQGAGSDVAVADLANDEYINCDVDVKAKYANYVEYEYTPHSIPLAASSDYQAANEYVDITNDLNREIIKAELHDGTYKLSVDGVELGTYSDEDFASGVNIATLSKNPNQIISQEIEKLNIERRNNEIRIRNTWFQEFNKDKISYMNWVNIVSKEENGRMVADPDYKEKEEYKNASQADKNSMDTYAEVKLNPDKFTDAIDSCIAQMYEKAQAAVRTAHTVKIERVGTSSEGIQLPNFFTENMVLQRGKVHTIWGKGNPGAEYTVTLSNDENTAKATAVVDESGAWKADLSALPVSDKVYTLTVEGDGEITSVGGIRIGDVYFAAGQSNMEQAVKHLPTQIKLQGGYKIEDAPKPVTNKDITFINLSAVGSSTRTFDVKLGDGMTGWEPLDDSNKDTMSLIAMFFADKMQKKENVPIGIISAAWGGTRIDRWSRSGYQNSDNIYNNHVYPFINYKINGILWYQGCSDADNDNWLAGYQNSFPQLIDDWRDDWGDEGLPFIYAQLARYNNGNYMRIREAQRSALDKVKNTDNVAMITTIDTDKGTSCNIHPLGKDIIADRFYAAARNIIFNDNTEAYEGPMFESAVPSGNKIIVNFKEGTADGLKVRNPDYSIAQDGSGCSASAALDEFEIAGDDMKFVKASAVIAGNTVEVSSASVAKPKYVRYAYSKAPENPNLYNGADLPCAPFTSVKEINMVCIGDSITEGIGVYKAEDKYPARLQTMLNAASDTEYVYNVINMGVSGTCLTAKSNSPYTRTEKYRQAYFASADIYTVSLGGNDSKNYISDTENAMNFTHIDDIENDYLAIIEKLRERNPKAKIYICIPIPVLNNGEGERGNNGGVGINEPATAVIRERIKAFAQKYNVDIIDVDEAFRGAFENGIDGMDSAKYTEYTDNKTGYTYSPVERYLYDRNAGSPNDSIFVDNVHPGSNGARLFAETIFNRLEADGLVK